MFFARQSFRRSLACSVALPALLAAAGASAEDRVTVISIPAGDTAHALQELARQTHDNLLFAPQIIHGMQSRELSGLYTTEQAARELLAGTSLDVVRDPVGALVVRQRVAQNTAPAAQPGTLSRAGATAVAAATQTAALAPVAVLAAAEPVPEQVLVTGSLIHGTVAVGAPVTTLSAQDFVQTGALTVADVLRSDPAVFVLSSTSVTNGGGTAGKNLVAVDIHGLSEPANSTNTAAPRTAMLIDGLRYPVQGGCSYDPSIIPALAIDRIDVLADGASATYGSDAIAGVVNVVLKRGFDGAITQFQIGTAQGGDFHAQATQLYGRTWDGGDITLSYEWYNVKPIPARDRSGYTVDYSLWGLNNSTPLASSVPGTISNGAPTSTTGTSCTNCYSIPAGQNGVGLTWAAILAHPGVTNELNPYLNADATPAQQRNAATVTFDQRLFDGVSLFGEGFYSNRRAEAVFPPFVTSAAHNEFTVAVPTINPYYPAGAPSGLRVSYNLSYELPPTIDSYEVSQRYAGGFNLDLPFDWKGKLAYSDNAERNFSSAFNAANTNNISAAVGNTIAAVAASGSTPAIASWTKPSNIPYLNLFCDPLAFACNSPTTLNYVSGYNNTASTFHIYEYNATFDGPLFAIPGGEVRAAAGAAYDIYNFYSVTTANYNSTAIAFPTITPNSQSRDVWAIFAQLNIPLFSSANAMPLLRKLDLEVSVRHDGYSDFGPTTNPKVALNWTPIDGFIFRGTWGTSFRAPSFSQEGTTATIQALNTAAGASSNSTPACATVGTTPVAGSAAAVLNPTCSATLQYPGGIAIGGGSGGAAFLRGGNGELQPETATNYGFGAEYAPAGFLGGLDLQVTYFNVRINNVIQPFQLTVGAGLNDPATAFTVILPSNPNFQTYVNQLIASPFSQVSPSQATNIKFINDSSNRNAGSLAVSGIDFAASYDWDSGQFGEWNTGISGTYFLQNTTVYAPGAAPVHLFNVGGSAQGIRFRYRGRLGWSDDGWSVTAFMNYQAHYFSTQALPPAQYLATFPGYSNLEPSLYTFDVSLGYNLSDKPANDYMKNINFQFVITDVNNRLPPFMYRVSTTGGNPAAFDISDNPVGRVFTLVVTKTW